MLIGDYKVGDKMKKSTPAISVIIPMYKVEPYIRTCVDSVLNQTFQDFEIIIVDDASPDNCYEICRQAYGNNTKVQILRHKQNQGLGSARNTGMQHAIGKYIYFLDSDDLILPNTIEKLYEAAENTGAEVVHMTCRYGTNIKYIINNQASIPLKIIKEEYCEEGYFTNNLKERFSKYWMNWNFHFWEVWTNLYRRQFLESNNMKFISVIAEDLPFAFAMFCFAKSIFKINFSGYVYVERQGSIMKSPGIEKYSKTINSMILIVRNITEIMKNVSIFSEEPTLKDICINNLLENLNGHFIYPHYKNGNISFELDKAAEKSMTYFFDIDSSLIKYWFHRANLFRERLINVVEKNKIIQESLLSIIQEQPYMFDIINSLRKETKRIIIMGITRNINLGDQAITIGEFYLLKKFFPEHEIIEIPNKYFVDVFKDLFFALDFKRYINEEDIIFLQGGGNLGNIWLWEENIRKLIISKFPNNKIVIFPQSIYFTDDREGYLAIQDSIRIYNAHTNLHLICRDEASFGIAQNIFPNVHKYLTPDSVMALQGILDNEKSSRDGVLFILRKDKEKVRNDEIIDILQKYLGDININYGITDTFIEGQIFKEQRNEKILEKLRQIRSSKLIITDRFHGVIFSVVTKTPVLAFKSYDTKISSGIQWFKNLPTVFYAENKTSEDMKNFIDKAIEGNAGEWNDEVNYEKILIDTLQSIFSNNN